MAVHALSAIGDPNHRARRRGDRFIPDRGAMDVDRCTFQLIGDGADAGPSVNASPAKEEYKKELAHNLLAGPAGGRVLPLSSCAPPHRPPSPQLRLLYRSNQMREACGRTEGRYIPNSPERILDAPGLVDDYYLNLLDWNADNMLSVALGDSVYLWNAATSATTHLMSTLGGHVTSLAWAQRGNLLAVGTSENDVELWDTHRCKRICRIGAHCGRVGVLSWNGNVLSSGSRDARIVHHDVRAPAACVGAIQGHESEVCGLKWSPAGVQLASGGNDNALHIWDARRAPSSRLPLFTLSAHRAAVKALAWCPWQKNLLASGGGTADRMIRFWNTSNGALVNAVDTHSQVCALQWSKHDKELVSSHGFSHNQVVLWRYPMMVKASELTGHTARVLHLAQSPDGTTVASAAADETLRFWRILGQADDGRCQRHGHTPLRASRSAVDASAWTGASVVR